MHDDVERTVSERVAALIDECRREREACEALRERILAYRIRPEASAVVAASRADSSHRDADSGKIRRN